MLLLHFLRLYATPEFVTGQFHRLEPMSMPTLLSCLITSSNAHFAEVRPLLDQIKFQQQVMLDFQPLIPVGQWLASLFFFPSSVYKSP